MTFFTTSPRPTSRFKRGIGSEIGFALFVMTLPHAENPKQEWPTFAVRANRATKPRVKSRSERLLGVHRELDELFVLHGEALLERELELAQALLLAYRALLFMHLEHEEAQLLPLYAELGPRARFPLVLYRGQHEKIRGMLDALVTATAALEGDSRAVRRAILALFDRHTTFKHLLEHHDGAERDGLFAALDEGAPASLDDGVDAWWARRRTYDELVARAGRLAPRT